MESHHLGELGFRRGPQVNPPPTAACLWGLPPAEPWARETEPPPQGEGEGGDAAKILGTKKQDNFHH